jgi:hypothetical protein
MSTGDDPQLSASMRRHAAELCSECQTFSTDGNCLHGPVCVADRLLEIADTCVCTEAEPEEALRLRG